MSQDFYLSAAQQRAAELEMELSAAKTDLLTFRHSQDLQQAGEAVQRIANLTAEQSNLRALCEGYVQSQQPRQPEVPSEEELQHRARRCVAARPHIEIRERFGLEQPRCDCGMA
jgi:hypothetical protein